MHPRKRKLPCLMLAGAIRRFSKILEVMVMGTVALMGAATLFSVAREKAAHTASSGSTVSDTTGPSRASVLQAASSGAVCSGEGIQSRHTFSWPPQDSASRLVTITPDSGTCTTRSNMAPIPDADMLRLLFRSFFGFVTLIFFTPEGST